MSNTPQLAKAREAFERGDMRKAMGAIRLALTFNKALSRTDLEEFERLVAQISERTTGGLKTECQQLSNAVAARMIPLPDPADVGGAVRIAAQSRSTLAGWPVSGRQVGNQGSYNDPLLVALARAADAGDECPLVRLILGNGTVVGRPGPAVGFLEKMRDPMEQTLAAGAGHGAHREPGAARVAGLLGAVHEHVDIREDDDPAALTIYDASWSSAAGTGGIEHMPALRVPLGAVCAWWIAGGTPVAPPKEGATWFGGIVF